MGTYFCKHSVLLLQTRVYFFIAAFELMCKCKVRSRTNLDPACEIHLELFFCSKEEEEGLQNWGQQTLL